jgi:pimeloyl-ACP methyl ester carboxylesterase
MPGASGLHWTSFDGLKLFARDYPSPGGQQRLPVICLHGLTRNSRDFEDLAPILAAEGRRVIAPDVRGRGLSERSPDPARYQPAVYARDIAALLDHEGIERAIFIGTSMGGLITMALAARRLRHIAGAILNEAGPEIDPRGIERILSYAGRGGPFATWPEAAEYLREINAVAFPDFGAEDWRKLADRLFYEDSSGQIVAACDPAIATILSRPPPRLAKPLARWLFRRLARKRPTMLIRGEISDVITAPIAERMKKAAPKVSEAVVPGVGHAPTLTEPAALDAIRAFLARLA